MKAGNQSRKYGITKNKSEIPWIDKSGIMSQHYDKIFQNFYKVRTFKKLRRTDIANYLKRVELNGLKWIVRPKLDSG